MFAQPDWNGRIENDIDHARDMSTLAEHLLKPLYDGREREREKKLFDRRTNKRTLLRHSPNTARIEGYEVPLAAGTLKVCSITRLPAESSGEQ